MLPWWQAIHSSFITLLYYYNLPMPWHLKQGVISNRNFRIKEFKLSLAYSIFNQQVSFSTDTKLIRHNVNVFPPFLFSFFLFSLFLNFLLYFLFVCVVYARFHMWIHMATSEYGLSITLEKSWSWASGGQTSQILLISSVLTLELQAYSLTCDFLTGELEIQTQALAFVQPAPLSYLPISKQGYF